MQNHNKYMISRLKKNLGCLMLSYQTDIFLFLMLVTEQVYS